MSIMWVAGAVESVGNGSDVFYAEGATTDLTLTATGSWTSYSFKAADYGTYTSGQLHTAYLKKLKPDTLYSYKCGDSATDDWSAVYQFRTLPVSAPTTQTPFVIGVVGDLGQTEDSMITVEHLQADSEMSVIVHAGDLAYADCNQTRWDTYNRMVEPLAAVMPWMVSIGNHEIEQQEGTGTFFEGYRLRYAGMPEYAPAEDDTPPYSATSCTPSIFTAGDYNYGNSYYSFNTSNVYWIILNSYTHIEEGSKQYKWLEMTLESIDRGDFPWVFVIAHCPMYNSNDDHQNEAQTKEMKTSIETLLYHYKVTGVISGHVHAYERMDQVYKDSKTKGAPYYFNIGDGGNREGHAEAYPTTNIPAWSAFRDNGNFGHARIVVYNSTHAVWEWHRNVDEEFEVADSVWIVNE
jgi:hypothetical protein